MPIRSLSESTSRVLTSTQALNNATSVIKELVDNALDARASSISIEIASNTLEKIIVKDDGSGVGVDDRRYLCKRGCTSKIENLDDLAKLGGTYLGFRGTALASIAELSKTVTIVTKVDGEQLGTTMTFGPAGTLLSSASISHHTGTTIRIENLLCAVPVRRQVVLKNPSKILEEIKKTLQAYALTRPAVKISLKVLKAKNDKANWSFAACKEGNQLTAAVAQVFGKSLAKSCNYFSESSDGSKVSTGYHANAILLDVLNKGVSKSGNFGQYMSIDGRPVKSDKGIMKELVKKYKFYLEQASIEGSTIPAKPFLILHLSCPSRSYDVNIEPAKDDVLFHDKQKILELVEKLFVTAYGEQDHYEAKRTRISNTSPMKSNALAFDVLLARKRTDIKTNINASHEIEDAKDTSSDHYVSSSNASLIESYVEAMNGDAGSVQADSEGSPTITIDNDPDEVEVYDPNDITINNPFIRAKASSISHSKQINTSTPRTSHRRPLGIYYPPTPDPSPLPASGIPYQNPGPPIPRRSKRGEEDSGSDNDALHEMYNLDRRTSPQEQSMLTAWIRSSTDTNSTTHPGSQSETVSSAKQARFFHTPLKDVSHVHSNGSLLERSTLTKKPFRPPLKKSSPNNSPHKASTTCSDDDNDRRPPRPAVQSSTAATGPDDDDDDLHHILQFEQRKKLVNQPRKTYQAISNPAELFRTQQKTNDSPLTSKPQFSTAKDAILSDLTSTPDNTNTSNNSTPPTRSPHKNRYLAAKRALEPTLTDSSNSPPTIPPTDPRALLITHLHSSSSKHIKTSLLPFERIPPSQIQHNIRATPPTLFPALSDLYTACTALKRHDPYIVRGGVESVDWSALNETWQGIIEGLVRNRYSGTGDEEGREIDLVSAVERHLDRV